jgi:hypothetical protein
LENNTYIYTGNPITPNFTINIGGQKLSSGTDYDIEFTDNVNVGTAHVTITGKGRFKGVIQREFEIKPVPARSLSFFADNTEFAYTGEPCMMQIAVKFGDVTLKEGVDYTVEYIENVNPGTAQALITFMGNFYGVMTIPYEIYALPEPEAEPLENTSQLSSQKINLGESVIVTAAARGGKAPYTYSVQYCKVALKKWMSLQDFSENAVVEIKPKAETRYIIVVKVKDSKGTIAKQYFKISVSGKEELQDTKAAVAE